MPMILDGIEREEGKASGNRTRLGEIYGYRQRSNSSKKNLPSELASPAATGTSQLSHLLGLSSPSYSDILCIIAALTRPSYSHCAEEHLHFKKEKKEFQEGYDRLSIVFGGV